MLILLESHFPLGPQERDWTSVRGAPYFPLVWAWCWWFRVVGPREKCEAFSLPAHGKLASLASESHPVGRNNQFTHSYALVPGPWGSIEFVSRS